MNSQNLVKKKLRSLKYFSVLLICNHLKNKLSLGNPNAFVIHGSYLSEIIEWTSSRPSLRIKHLQQETDYDSYDGC